MSLTGEDREEVKVIREAGRGQGAKLVFSERSLLGTKGRKQTSLLSQEIRAGNESAPATTSMAGMASKVKPDGQCGDAGSVVTAVIFTLPGRP